MMYSYDVFDTIITRRTATPHGIFSLIQDSLIYEKEYSDIPDDIRYNFFELRIIAERMARSTLCSGNNEEISLTDIYNILNTTQEMTDEMITRIMSLEIRLECENCLSIPYIVNEIEEHVSKGEQVVLISDMYLPREVVQEMLSCVSSVFGNVPIYISSEYGKTKESGNLYKLVAEKEGVSFSEWIHCGDNELSDDHIPASFGIKTKLIRDSQLTGIEKGILKSEEDNSDVQMMIGLSKYTRIINRFTGPSAVGATLGGTLLVCYVRWIIRDALKRKIKSLYFVARDGYVLKIIADIIISELGLHINTKYIYGSRKAWRMPALTLGEFDVMELFHASMPDHINTFSKIAGLFDISVEKLAEFLNAEITDKERLLSRLDADAIFYTLSDNSAFTDYLKSINETVRENALCYLKQEIEDAGSEIAFVEIGGTGYTQKCLGLLLKQIGVNKISTYYFNLYSIDPGQKEIFRNFIPDELYIKDAIEPLCRAPHGQTLSYYIEDGLSKPLLDDKEDEELFKRCGYDEYIFGLKEYVNVLTKYYPDVLSKQINRKIVRKCWNYYTHVNDKDILDFIGEIPFDVKGSATGTYAPKLAREDIVNIFGKQTDVSSTWFYNGASIRMSCLRMSEEEKALMEKLKSGSSTTEVRSEKKQSVSTLARIPNAKYHDGIKIAIYGAGVLGREIHAQVLEEGKYELAGWFDKNYESLNRQGLNLDSPTNVMKYDFEILLIAIFKKSVAEVIRTDLIDKGVPADKIDWISPEEFVRENG